MSGLSMLIVEGAKHYKKQQYVEALQTIKQIPMAIDTTISSSGFKNLTQESLEKLIAYIVADCGNDLTISELAYRITQSAAVFWKDPKAKIKRK